MEAAVRSVLERTQDLLRRTRDPSLGRSLEAVGLVDEIASVLRSDAPAAHDEAMARAWDMFHAIGAAYSARLMYPALAHTAEAFRKAARGEAARGEAAPP